ncbi:alpha/beta hydrolase-fold protein [Vulgatibacter sp.]|uniref:alpha/beta hydrolase-fold protein n=1 Tax=Vulgatibacter sp. TaxID=1971226 RepID=UPI003566A18B
MRRLALLPLVALAACSDPEEKAPAPTYRAIAGFSMGAMGATFVGGANPERFDAIGSLGGPVDVDYLLGYLERSWVGGFCTLAELEAILAAHPGDPAVLDDPARLPCMAPAAAQAEAVLPEHAQSFVGWIYGDNGGSFDRDAYLDLFTDLSLAFGNPLTHNPDSPFLPPGVSAADLDRGAALCDAPVVIEGLHNAEYNPDGSYPVITFCDGEEPALFCADTGTPIDFCAGDPDELCAAEGGVVTATERERGDLFRAAAGAYAACWDHRRPVPFALAVDLNRNGRRDYGEPLVVNAHERWDDVGADGCANDREDGSGGCSASGATGDPNGDDYHWRDNPGGTEGNWQHDEGEPFRDFGLDGVEGTGDFGEGDGVFSEAPGRTRFRSFDPDALLSSWSGAERRRLGYYADGGIRDLFNFGVSAAHAWSHFAAGHEGARAYLGLADLPGAPAKDSELDPLALRADDLPRRMLFLYGDPAAAPAAIRAGDGDHVGTSRQLLNRFYLFLRWLSVRWADVEDPPADRSGVQSRTHDLVYESAALGAERNYTVVLPPGYDDPRNAEARYPVLYLLHGYGMQPGSNGGFAESALLFDGAMASGALRKMIVVFPSGRCCHEDGAGNRICTEDRPDGYGRECRSGTFFVDRAGVGAGDDTRYGEAILELLDEVDRRFRTRSAGR